MLWGGGGEEGQSQEAGGGRSSSVMGSLLAFYFHTSHPRKGGFHPCFADEETEA